MQVYSDFVILEQSKHVRRENYEKKQVSEREKVFLPNARAQILKFELALEIVYQSTTMFVYHNWLPRMVGIYYKHNTTKVFYWFFAGRQVKLNSVHERYSKGTMGLFV